jgi:hypothetical protein
VPRRELEMIHTDRDSYRRRIPRTYEQYQYWSPGFSVHKLYVVICAFACRNDFKWR